MGLTSSTASSTPPTRLGPSAPPTGRAELAIAQTLRLWKSVQWTDGGRGCGAVSSARPSHPCPGNCRERAPAARWFLARAATFSDPPLKFQTRERQAGGWPVRGHDAGELRSVNGRIKHKKTGEPAVADSPGGSGTGPDDLEHNLRGELQQPRIAGDHLIGTEEIGVAGC